MKKTILLSGVLAALAVPGLAAASATPPAIDLSGADMTPMLTTFTDLFTTHVPTIVAIAAIGFALAVVINIMRKAKGVAK